MYRGGSDKINYYFSLGHLNQDAMIVNYGGFRQDILSADTGGNSDVANAKALYGRVGVKTEGTEQAVWTPVVKLK
jgi:hypothetical protein